MLNAVSVLVIPIMLLVIIIYGVKEKKDVFSLFIEGAISGLKIAYNIFPYMLGIMIAIGLLRETGAINILLYPLSPILQFFGVPSEILPLCILKPLSGSASMSVVMDIFNQCGVDSIQSKMASIIMATTETTLYCISILYGAVKIKKIRGTLIAGLTADITAMAVAILLVKIGMI